MLTWFWRGFLIWYAVGIVLLALDLIPPALEWANAVFLYWAGLIGAVYIMERFGRAKGAALSLFIIITTIAIESFGEKTGLIFGRYQYEEGFGFEVLGVPMTIGFAWLTVISTGLALISPQHKPRRIMYPVLAAFLAVAMDLVIDPVAFHLKNYWTWEEGGPFLDIPTKNFVGWFAVALFIHIILYFFIGNEEKTSPVHERRARVLYVLIILMFAVTAVVGGIGLAAVVSLALMAVTMLVARYV